MSRTLDYILTAIVGLTIACFVIIPMTNHVAKSLNDSANMIAEATYQH